MKFTLRQLEVYLATAHTGNLSRAAEQLALSQSAASEALKSLESQFDIQLFDRVGKRLKLNALGRQLRPEAESLLEQARQLERHFHQPDSGRGQLNIGATLSIGNYIGISLLTRYRKKYPGVKVSLEVANTRHIVERLLNFDIDLGMVEGEVNHADLNITPWRPDELVVFCAPDHPLANSPHLTDKDLIQAGWILREEGSGTRQAFDNALRGLLPKLNILLELQHTEAIKRAVESGMGLGCLSRITLQEALRRGSLVELSVPQRNFQRQLYLMTHREKYLTQDIGRWLAICEAHP